MRLIPLSLLLFFTFNTLLNAQEWTIKTIAEGVKPSIACDLEGNPHIAFMLEDRIEGFVSHAVLEEDSFVATEIARNYYYGPLDIAIDKTGLPAIALHNHNDEDENIYRLTSSGDWVLHRVEDSGHDGWDNSITFDSNNNPHTSSTDPSQFGSNDGVEYSWFDGEEWHTESIGSAPVMYMFSTSIALDAEDNPHISYYDDQADKMQYASKSEGAWNIETVAEGGGMFSSLLIDGGGRPHLSFYSQMNGLIGEVKYAWKEGDNWIIETVDTLFNVPIEFAGARNVTSLEMDTEGRLHISYGDREVVKYGIRENGTWAIETVVDESGSQVLLGVQTSLCLSPDGRPHISYFEATSLTPLRGIIKYATREIVNPVELPTTPDASLMVFPNPAKDFIELQWQNTNVSTANIIIYDVNGRVILQKNEVNTQRPIRLDIRLLSSGTFIVEVKAGQKNLIKRVVILE